VAAVAVAAAVVAAASGKLSEESGVATVVQIIPSLAIIALLV
jgi:hypothetical protein